jgi:predicted nucleic acid-binding protein
MSLPTNSKIVVVDANVLISVVAKEYATHKLVESTLKSFSQSGWLFVAPHVMVAEVLYALCQKLRETILTLAEYEEALDSFQRYLTIVSFMTDDAFLAARAVETRESYGCSRSSDGLYIALADVLARNNQVELLTLDAGMVNQAARNSSSVTVNLL